MLLNWVPAGIDFNTFKEHYFDNYQEHGGIIVFPPGIYDWRDVDAKALASTKRIVLLSSKKYGAVLVLKGGEAIIADDVWIMGFLITTKAPALGGLRRRLRRFF